jgi:predicted O-methyltransferase YrrM
MDDRAWSLTPAGLRRVLSEVAAGRETIVECGSGESTVAIGRLLAERGAGRLYSLEHDPHWLAETAARLERDGAGERVELLRAPLRDGWYDAAAVERLPEAIDLLLVDGPPGDESADGLARYPALPRLARRLAPGALVIVDDIHRPGERAIVERWRREHGVDFELHPRERLAIGVFSAAQDPAPAGTSLERGT